MSRRRRVPFTEGERDQINLRRRVGASIGAIAQQYGVPTSAIRRVVAGEWPVYHPGTVRYSELTRAERANLVMLRTQFGFTYDELQFIFGVSGTTVYKVLCADSNMVVRGYGYLLDRAEEV